MTPRLLGSLLVFLPFTLAAQSLKEHAIPLNGWAAPRQGHRSQLHAQQRVATPKLQLPGGVTTDVLVFVPLKPCRLADTRPSQPYPALGTTPLVPLTARTLPIAGSCGVESTGFLFPGPEAFSLNVTVVPPAGNAGGYLLVYPNPITPIPLVASMAWNPGASFQSNAVVAAASPGGSVNVVANATTDVVIDINGYYAAPTDPQGDTALGTAALNSDTSGTGNTAFGYFALEADNTGSRNTAFGVLALATSTNGTDNTAVGYEAMYSSAAPAGNAMYGYGNTAIGSSALQNPTGSENTAVGFEALALAGGLSNTAVGMQALANLVSGPANIAIGWDAGYNLTAGGYNIMIGSQGTSGDTQTIRIGAPGAETSTYIAGISGIGVSGGTTVVVNSSGQL